MSDKKFTVFMNEAEVLTYIDVKMDECRNTMYFTQQDTTRLNDLLTEQIQTLIGLRILVQDIMRNKGGFSDEHSAGF